MKKIKRVLADGAACCGGEDDCVIECSASEKRRAAKEIKADAKAEAAAK